MRNFPEFSETSLPLSPFFVNARQLAYIGVDELFPAPVDHPDGLKWATRDIAPAYRLHWVLIFLIT